MVLDQVENFIRVSVSGSHASGDSTISLQSGEASTLPDPSNGKYNLVWFDSKNYRLPDKDPNVEIIRINSVDTSNDTISVTRGQENTTATTKSETEAEYELLLGQTAKTIQEIDQFKLDASAYSPESDTHDRYEDSEARTAVDGASVDISGSANSLVTSSFDVSEDTTTNDLVISDSNNVELIRQPESGPTQFLQGVDAGPISAPEDSFTQLINASVTSSLSSGSTVGYTLSLDNQSILSIEGEGDGSGGIQNTEIVSGRTLDINSNDIVDNASTIWDTSSQEIPDSSLGTVSTSTLSNNSVTVAGNSVSLGASTSVNHSDLSNIGSSDHHTKTSSASELTDVSPDSTSDAHHSKYTDSDATSAVGASTPFANSDLSNSSITIEGNSVSLGGSTSVNHNDLSSISSDDHHSKYTDSDAQSAIDGTTPKVNGVEDTNGTTRFFFGSNESAFTDEDGNKRITLNSTNDIDINLTGASRLNINDNAGSNAIFTQKSGRSEFNFSSLDLYIDGNIVSSDSVSDAHHSKYTDSDATSAVGASTPFSNSDLSNSSITIEGNSVSLGGSTSVNHNDLSSISSSDHHSKTSSASELTDVSPDSTSDAHHSKYTDSNAVSAVNGSTLSSGLTLNGTLNMGSDNLHFQPASSGGSVTGLTFESNTNAGSDYGYIEYHDDYFSGGESGSLVLKTENDSGGSSGPDAIVLDGVGGTYINRGSLNLYGHDLEDSGTTIWDQSNSYIPQGRLENDNVTIEGNSVSLGGSTSVNHNDLSSISSNDHHSKTSSASELTDVSPDSTSDAHHSKYTDSDAVTAVNNESSLSVDISGDADTVDGNEASELGVVNETSTEYNVSDNNSNKIFRIIKSNGNIETSGELTENSSL